MSFADDVRRNLGSVRARIDEAARSAGRDPSTVALVAVTKRLDANAVRAAYAAGQRDFGENYVQEAASKIAELTSEMPDARWHLIGRLQSNKAAVAAKSFCLLHGIDSLSTVAALSKVALREGHEVKLLVQVRLGLRGAEAPENGGQKTQTGETRSNQVGRNEAGRSGLESSAVAAFLRQIDVLEGVRVVGLMGVADPDLDALPQFRALRELATHLANLGFARAPLGELSMGMTDDLEAAVAEGATLVRIGTAIFGERPGN